jgi:hypothetical protein
MVAWRADSLPGNAPELIATVTGNARRAAGPDAG